MGKDFSAYGLLIPGLQGYAPKGNGARAVKGYMLGLRGSIAFAARNFAGLHAASMLKNPAVTFQPVIG